MPIPPSTRFSMDPNTSESMLRKKMLKDADTGQVNEEILDWVFLTRGGKMSAPVAKI